MIALIKLLILFGIPGLKFKTISKSADIIKREMMKWLFDKL